MKKYIVCAVFFCLGVNAQTLFVRPYIESQITYLVADIQKITFNNGNMLITNNTGSNSSFALSGLRYLSFTDFNMGTTNPNLVSNNYYVYPNPAIDLLTISGSNINYIQILSLDGRVLMEQKPLNESLAQVDISFLPQGIYVCKIRNNTKQQNIKFIKN